MSSFIRLSVRDCLIAGAAAAVAMAAFYSEAQGFSLLTGCIWATLNFYLLALLIVSLSPGKAASRLFIFMLACAKIPASYYLLFWLYRVDYLEPVGLTAGITILPVVLLFRGLAAARAAGTAREASEEG